MKNVSPTKQLITEEKMIDYMNGLHISKEFTSHATSSLGGGGSNIEAFNVASSALITMTQLELEKKLKNAQSITICEEIKSLGSDSIIPKILLERMEKPCTALVVWQPPKSLTNVYETIRTNISNATSSRSSTSSAMLTGHNTRNNYGNNSSAANNKIDDEEDVEEDGVFCDFDNNNSTALDLNNCMDLDV